MPSLTAVSIRKAGNRNSHAARTSTSTGGTFPQNEEYDPVADTWRQLNPMPTPRHGTASGTIDGVVYVVGGGATAGSSFTNLKQAFSISP